MKIIELSEGDVPSAQAVVNLMVEAGQAKHPILNDIRQDVFRGARCWVLYGKKTYHNQLLPLSINCTKIGKRHKNIWEPVANWYSAYTLPSVRRTGLAYRLYAEVERVAVLAGCRRIKSLAGSRAGLGLHRSLRHQCWGETENGEVYVNSPLPGASETLYTGLTPPQAPGALLSLEEIEAIMTKGLRYDTHNELRFPD